MMDEKTAGVEARKNGMNYAPKGKPNPVCKSGEFHFAAVGLDHGHIYGMCNGLTEAGADVVWVYDPDIHKCEAFKKEFPQVKIARSEEEVLNDESIQMVANAGIPADRCAMGLKVLDHGKHYFSDKPPLTTLEQLQQARQKVKQTALKYAVYYSERLHVESGVYAGELIAQGAIGRVLQVVNLAPHRIGLSNRPDWFFNKERYGGILVDIGSHQVEQFLSYSGAKDARVLHSTIANYHHKQYPDFEDFGDATLLADNGATQYFRVDWFTPDGLGVWGDGRVFILGTDGTIELRKYIDIARDETGDHIYLVNQEGKYHLPVAGQVGYPYFGQLILDCIHSTEKAMTQEHAFKAIEISIHAQMQAELIEA
jgi:predicted dehydrogenase